MVVGAHQNLNGLRDLTTPLSGMVCHPWASTCYLQIAYQPNLKFLFPLTYYEDMKGDKMSKWGGLG